MPQLPDTLKVSVVAWAKDVVAKAINIAAKENILNVFMIIYFRFIKLGDKIQINAGIPACAGISKKIL
jgi:hypothetical protein